MIAMLMMGYLAAVPSDMACFEFVTDTGERFETISLPAHLPSEGFEAITNAQGSRLIMRFQYDDASRCFFSPRIVICRPGDRSDVPEGGQVVTSGQRVLFGHQATLPWDFAVWDGDSLESFGTQESLRGQVSWSFQRVADACEG